MQRIITAVCMFMLCMAPGTLTARHYYYHHRNKKYDSPPKPPLPKARPGIVTDEIWVGLDKWPVPIIAAFACENPEVEWCAVYHRCANASLARGGRELR